MNIVVRTVDGHVVTRPDTTWERDNEDLYLPDSVTSLSYTPVLFVLVSKPGRSVSRRFASRYYKTVGYGVLLYPDDYIDGSEEGYACASCLDHSSFLQLSEAEAVTGAFHLEKNGYGVFDSAVMNDDAIAQAIEEVTSRIYIRTGDIIAMELQSRKPLYSRKEGNVRVYGQANGRTLVDFNIIVE